MRLVYDSSRVAALWDALMQGGVKGAMGKDAGESGLQAGEEGGGCGRGAICCTCCATQH